MVLKAKQQKDQEETSTTTTETPVQQEPTTDVAAASSTGKKVSTFVGKTSAFVTHPDVLEALADVGYGDVPSVVASNGTHQVSGRNEDLGKIIKFQAVSAKRTKKLVPGETGDEAKEYFQVSDDGIHTRDGVLLEDALEDAKAAGYDRAKISTYIDVVAIIVESDNADFIGETVILQLAPSSQRSWKPLETKCKTQALRGQLNAKPVWGNEEYGNAVVFTSVATPTSWSGNNFTKFEFSV